MQWKCLLCWQRTVSVIPKFKWRAWFVLVRLLHICYLPHTFSKKRSVTLFISLLSCLNKTCGNMFAFPFMVRRFVRVKQLTLIMVVKNKKSRTKILPTARHGLSSSHVAVNKLFVFYSFTTPGTIGKIRELRSNLSNRRLTLYLCDNLYTYVFQFQRHSLAKKFNWWN